MILIIIIIIHVVKLCSAASVMLPFIMRSGGALYNLAETGDYGKALLMMQLSLIP